MRITLKANTADVVAAFAKSTKQAKYATAQALNRTAEDFQAEQRKGQADRFKVRQSKFARDSVKIRNNERARPNRPEVTVRIETPGGGKRNDVWTRHENAGRKTPISGSRVAVPIGVRRGTGGAVSKAQRIRELDLRPVVVSRRNLVGSNGRFLKDTKRNRNTGQSVRSRRVEIRGKNGTWLVQGKSGKVTIMQRRGRGQLRVLYTLRKSTPLRPRLAFHVTARRVAGSKYATNFRTEFARAMQTAR